MPAHSTRPTPRLVAIGALLFATMAVACDGFNDPPPSPLEGLTYIIATDSTGTLAPAAPNELVPGHFVGTVLGAPLPGSGNDSLETMPRIAGAIVTAYPVIAGTGAFATLDHAEASAITDVDGRFTLPQVPGGEYVLTFEPPAGSGFVGSYASVFAYSESHEFSHWIILARQ